MTGTDPLRYRVVVRDLRSTHEITDWLDEHVEPGDWRVELLEIEEVERQNRPIRFAVCFRHRLDMMNFKRTWLRPSQHTSPMPSEGELRPVKGLQIITHFLMHPEEEMYIRKRRGSR